MVLMHPPKVAGSAGVSRSGERRKQSTAVSLPLTAGRVLHQTAAVRDAGFNAVIDSFAHPRADHPARSPTRDAVIELSHARRTNRGRMRERPVIERTRYATVCC